MAAVRDIAAWLDTRLDAERFRVDEPENGLVVDAGLEVRSIAVSVNTSIGAIDAAANAGANLLLVHHASWSHIDLSLHDRKIEALRAAGISLYCAHTSLDAAEDGTGRAVAELLGIRIDGRFGASGGEQLGVHGTFDGGWDAMVELVTDRLGGAPETWRHRSECVRIGILTGAGGMTGWLEEARLLGLDTYITGEGSMYTRLFAKEVGLNLILAGHDLTETPGIEALGRATADAFELRLEFVREPHLG